MNDISAETLYKNNKDVDSVLNIFLVVEMKANVAKQKINERIKNPTVFNKRITG